MEPRVPAPARRIATIRALSAAGIPVRVMIAPVVPALTDHETEAILTAAKDAAAVAASQIVLRLPREVADLFRDWVQDRFPDRAARIMGRVRELHGGRDYDPAFGKRMTGEGEWAKLMQARFAIAARRLGLDRELPAMRTDLFRLPPRAGDQLSLAL
jgi:DNA repair photolyase